MSSNIKKPTFKGTSKEDKYYRELVNRNFTSSEIRAIKSPALDRNRHSQVVRTNPETMEREEIELNDEGWKKIISPDNVRKDWQKWLDEWLEMYEVFLTMKPPTQENFYVNHVATPEIMVMNFFHWPEGLGIDVNFKELRGNKQFNPVIIREIYGEIFNLNYEEEREFVETGKDWNTDYRNRRHRQLLHKAYQTKVLDYTGKGGSLGRVIDQGWVGWFPDLEVVNTNYSKDECYALLDKCWEGIQEDNKHRKEYVLLGDDYDILNCSNMKPHKSTWLKKKFQRNKRKYMNRDLIYKRFTVTLFKRKIVPKKDLIKPWMHSECKPNEVIFNIVDKSYLAYLGQSIQEHKVQTTFQGNRGAEESCYMVVPKEFQESEGFIYRNYLEEKPKK